MYVSKSDHMKSFQCLNMFWNRGKKKIIHISFAFLYKCQHKISQAL